MHSSEQDYEYRETYLNHQKYRLSSNKTTNLFKDTKRRLLYFRNKDSHQETIKPLW